MEEAILSDEPLRPAGKAKRIVNVMVDAFGYYLFLYVVMQGIKITAPNFLARWEQGQALAFFTNIAVFFLYYVICEGLTMRSPGKLLTGTKVVGFDGGIPSLGQIAGRTLLRHLPFEWLSIFGANGGGIPLHDRWSGTVVVDIVKEPE